MKRESVVKGAGGVTLSLSLLHGRLTQAVCGGVLMHTLGQPAAKCLFRTRTRPEKELSSDLCIIRQAERLLPPQKTDSLNIFALVHCGKFALWLCVCRRRKRIGGCFNLQNAIPTGCGGGRKRRWKFFSLLLALAFAIFLGLSRISITADSLMTLRYRVSPICRFGERESNFFGVLFTKLSISCRVCRRTERTAVQQTKNPALAFQPRLALQLVYIIYISISRAKNAASVFISMLNSTSYCYYRTLKCLEYFGMCPKLEIIV